MKINLYLFSIEPGKVTQTVRATTSFCYLAYKGRILLCRKIDTMHSMNV